MRTSSLLQSILIAAACCISLSSNAGGFTLVPGAPLSAAAPMEAKGRNGILIKQKLQFGDYHTTFVKRGWIKSWKGETGFPGLIWVTDMGGKQSIRYALTNGTDTIQAIATTRVRRHELNIGNEPGGLPAVVSSVLTIGTEAQSNNLSVALRIPGQEEAWELFMDNEAVQTYRSEVAGYLRNGQQLYTIHPVYTVRSKKGKIMNMPFGAAGIEFRDAEGRAVAAANLMNNGAVQLDNELPAQERLLLSAACTAMLLQSVI